jgi:ectoine utilization protein EutC
MDDIQVIDETTLRDTVKLTTESLAVIEDGFAALAKGGVQMPPVMRLDVTEHNGEMDAKSAYIPGFPYFALKVSCGFFDNPKKGLPSLGGLMNLFDSETGKVAALLLDNGYLTDIRTALAGAVAAKYLARKNSKVVGVIGTGLQARLQVEALRLVIDFDTVLVWGRDISKSQTYADEMQQKLNVLVEVCEEAHALVEASDVIVTTTPSTTPIIHAKWLRPGQHITAMGSDTPEKNELSPDVLSRADIYACDRRSQCEVLGELHHAIQSSSIHPETFDVCEIGEIITGLKSGRTQDEQITVCDLTGTGVQDTAIANYAMRKFLADRN